MKTVIAIDSMKGSLLSAEAGEAAAEGIRAAWPGTETVILPLADGGEGTVAALTHGMGGETVSVTVRGPLGQPVGCSYGIIGDARTAVIEIAGAAGITLIRKDERDPLRTSTYGAGEVILDAVRRGCRRFIIGIGGSATNDGGIGMLQALGYDLTDRDGRPVCTGALGLRELAVIGTEHVTPELNECSFSIACDVTNPLYGKNGCSAVFGPQKGADTEMIRDMDGWMRSYAALAGKVFPEADPLFPGSGAAGGLGFAFRTFLNADLCSGVKLVLEETRAEEAVRDADIVVTGEGRLDAQTVMGKAPGGIAALAKKYGKPVIAFAGCVNEDAKACNDAGIDAFFPILRKVCTEEEAMDKENAYRNLKNSAEQVFRAIRACNGK